MRLLYSLVIAFALAAGAGLPEAIAAHRGHSGSYHRWPQRARVQAHRPPVSHRPPRGRGGPWSGPGVPSNPFGRGGPRGMPGRPSNPFQSGTPAGYSPAPAGSGQPSTGNPSSSSNPPVCSGQPSPPNARGRGAFIITCIIDSARKCAFSNPVLVPSGCPCECNSPQGSGRLRGVTQ
jgi:hypothetical protein